MRLGFLDARACAIPPRPAIPPPRPAIPPSPPCEVMVLGEFYKRHETAPEEDLSADGIGLTGVGAKLLEELFTLPQGMSPEIEEAIEQFTAQTKAREKQIKALAAKAEAGGVKGMAAKNELIILEQGDTTEINRIELTLQVCWMCVPVGSRRDSARARVIRLPRRPRSGARRSRRAPTSTRSRKRRPRPRPRPSTRRSAPRWPSGASSSRASDEPPVACALERAARVLCRVRECPSPVIRDGAAAQSADLSVCRWPVECRRPTAERREVALSVFLQFAGRWARLFTKRTKRNQGRGREMAMN